MQVLYQKNIASTNILTKKRKLIKINAKFFLGIFISIAIFMIIVNPKLCINSIYSGLTVWATCVLPSLFPFMFFTKILTDLDFLSWLTNLFTKLNKILFKAPAISSYIFLMSIISGYPVGAKLISEFYEMGAISKVQANKLCTFCSTSGPLFIIGSVGTSMFLNSTLGYIMFLSHILGSFLNGILYRKLYVDDTEYHIEKRKNENENLLANSMKNSILSVMIVGGFIAISFLIIDLINNYNILLPINKLLGQFLSTFGISNEVASSLTSGFLEISKGSIMLSKNGLTNLQLGTLASLIIGFGGLSVFFQATAFLSKCQINYKFYLLQKFTHGIISGIITFLICLIFKI